MQGGVQESVVGRCANRHLVVAEQKLPCVLMNVEDRKIERIHGQSETLRFAGRQRDPLPGYEPLVTLAGGRRKRSVKLGGLRTFA